MTWNLFGVVQFAIVGMFVGIAANANTRAMVEEINASPAKRNTFTIFGWWAGKYLSVWDEHERLFPDSPRRRRAVICHVILFASFLIAGVALFTFRN
jgi:hypothetical protein